VLTSDSALNRTEAASAGAIEAVVAAMRGHVQSAELQARACRVLGNLSYGNAEKSEIRIDAGNAGATEAVVVSMRGHPEDLMLQQNACGGGAKHDRRQ